MHKTIELTKNKIALVDSDEFERITRFKWLYDRGYARRRFERKGVQHCMHMHREIIQAPEGFEVDHINGDTLDNRRANLRIVTHRENMFNMEAHKNSSSRFKGVYWNKEKQIWTTQIAIDGRSKHIGYFSLEMEAAEAYNEAATKFFGQYARLNHTQRRNGHHGNEKHGYKSHHGKSEIFVRSYF